MNRAKKTRREEALGAEGEFLLRCAQAALASREKSRCGAIDAKGLDWDKVFRLAEANRVMPLLAAAAAGNRIANMPAEIADRLRSRFRDGAQRTMSLAGELKLVLRAFDGEGIRCIPLKGPVLAAGSYRSLGLRDFDDLDLLVAPADAARAARVLARLGYAGWDIPEDRLAGHLATECEQTLICADRGAVVDLHWAMHRRYFTMPTDFETLWRRAGRVEIFGTSVPDLSAEDAVLFLCFHGGKHLFHRLAWVCDVAAAIAAHPALDWDGLLENATRIGAGRLVRLGLYLAERLLGARLPHGMHLRIRADRSLHLLAAEATGAIFQQRPPASEFQRQLEACRFHLRVRERISDRLRYGFWALVPNCRDWNGSRLPAALDFLHVLTRPVRLLRKHLGADTAATNCPILSPNILTAAKNSPTAFAS